MAARSLRVLDWAAAAAGLVGSSLLLRKRQHQPSPAGVPHSEASLDDSARIGRGRPEGAPTQRALAAGHETQDADAGAVARVLALLGATATASVLLMLGLLAVFRTNLQASRPPYTPEQSANVEPPRPQLEAKPEVDMLRQDAAARAQLDSYAWLDAAHTRARIPIARAQALAVGRSLDAAP